MVRACSPPIIFRTQAVRIHVAGIGTALALLTAPSLHDRTVRVVWNVSPSVPVGLYAVLHRQPNLGELALVRLPEAIAEFADRSGYLPRAALLLKPAAATAGDRVCRFGTDVFVRGRLAARTLMDDPARRDLPSWQGCRTLGRREVLLLAEHPASFDSRYFGPLRTQHVVGTAVPIWPRG